MDAFTTINPLTGKEIETYRYMDRHTVDRRVAETDAAFSAWRNVGLDERSEMMRACAGLLIHRAEQYAGQMAEEMGKPVRQGRSEAEKCAWVCEYFADRASEFLAPRTIKTGAAKSYACFEPLGPILAIMPWNFPFWQLFRFAAPAVMAGNTVVMKHAPGTAGCGRLIEQLFRDAGFPAGVLVNIFVGNDHVAEVIDHPLVRGVTLTGSTKAGRAVAAAAGRALKKTVLELGGSDPYLILEDADLKSAAELCVASRLINSGQSCIAAKRWIVVESVADEFQERVAEKMSEAVIGDPKDESTDIGPLARNDLRANLHRQVTRSIELGARCLLGGTLPADPGFFYEPTVLVDVQRGMPAFDEELFGPAAALVRARDENHAIDLANDSIYGLGAAVFTADRERGEAIARTRLHAGCCFVNDFVKSDPRLPFGGIGDSGYGRELGPFGILEFTNIKTVSVA